VQPEKSVIGQTAERSNREELIIANGGRVVQQGD
jgi:hypothetical protein